MSLGIGISIKIIDLKWKNTEWTGIETYSRLLPNRFKVHLWNLWAVLIPIIVLKVQCPFAQKKWIIWYFGIYKNQVCAILPIWLAGFEHSAFAFAYESRIAETRVFDEFVPPGALITFLQKALQYIELESHVRDVGIMSGVKMGRMTPKWTAMLLSPLSIHISVRIRRRIRVL